MPIRHASDLRSRIILANKQITSPKNTTAVYGTF